MLLFHLFFSGFFLFLLDILCVFRTESRQSSPGQEPSFFISKPTIFFLVHPPCVTADCQVFPHMAYNPRVFLHFRVAISGTNLSGHCLEFCSAIAPTYSIHPYVQKPSELLLTLLLLLLLLVLYDTLNRRQRYAMRYIVYILWCYWWYSV